MSRGGRSSLANASCRDTHRDSITTTRCTAAQVKSVAAEPTPRPTQDSDVHRLAQHGNADALRAVLDPMEVRAHPHPHPRQRLRVRGEIMGSIIIRTD